MKSRLWTIVLFTSMAFLYLSSLSPIALTDPDEVFYSLTAKEMMNAGSYVTPLIFGEPQFEKPPLFYWLLIGSFKIFGIGPLAARLIPALFGLLGVAATFLFCRRVFNDKTAYLAAILLGTSSLYLAMSKAVLTDIVLSVFIMIAFYGFYLWYLEKSNRYLYLFAIAAACAVLTKGPIAIIILLVTGIVFLLLNKEFKLLGGFLVHPWVLVFLAVSVPWYADVMVHHGKYFVDEFIIHDNWDRILRAEHRNFDRWYFYPLVVTIGLFPWIFYLTAIGRWWRDYKKESLFFLVWFLVTFIIFQCAHSKLASYILPLMPAVVIPLAIALAALCERAKRAVVPGCLYFLLGAGLLFAPVILVQKFPEYVWPAAMMSVKVFGTALIIGAVLLFKGKIFEAVIVKAVGLIIMFAVIGSFVPSSVGHAVANEYIRAIVEEEHYEGQPIVTNKLFARGVYFYTDNPVLVMDHNPQPFWSPHPIEVISKDDEISRFFNARERVLCVIKKSYLNDLERLFHESRVNRIISRDGYKVVVMSEKIK